MAGADIVFGGSGDDVVAWNDPTGDRVFGDGGNDILRGGDVAADTIFGGSGNDLIRAVANQSLDIHAADFLFGDAGRDTIIGGNAGDTIEGGSGNDVMAGFGGADRFLFREGVTDSDQIVDFEVTLDVVELVGFDAGFDAIGALSQETTGTSLDLGDGNEVLFVGLLVNEFSAANFLFA
jgi:serralysin